MQDNPFADLIPQQPVQPQAPGVIYGRPKQAAPITPLQLRQEERRDATAERQAIASERSAATADRMVSNDTRRFANEDLDRQAKLRGEFEARPDVKRFATVRTAREQIRSLVNAPNTTAQDDIAMIFSFMRALDPNSVVREGEFATAQNSAGVPEQVRNYFNRALNGERLSPEQRRSFGQTVDTLYQQERDLYNQKAIQYRDLATRQGIDPDVVARRYVPDEPAPIAGGAMPTITTGGGAPAGTDGIKFGAGPDSLDRKDLDFTQQLNQRFAQGQSGDEIRQWAASQGFALGEDFDKALSVRQKGGSATANLPVRNVPLAEQRGDGGFREGANAGLRGAGQSVTLGLLDEIGAAGQTIFEGGTMEDNLRSQRAVDDYDQQYNFLPSLAGQVVGGLALPFPAAANTPMRLAGVGAGYGAAYGFGSANGSLADRLGGAVSGGLVGGAIGGAGGLLSQRLAARGGPRPPSGVDQRVVDAAERQGVEIVRPDAVPGSRSTYSFLESLPFSGGRVRSDLQRGANQIEQRVADIGETANAVPRQTAGENLREAGERYVDRSRSVVSRMYDRAANLAGNAQVTPSQALKTVDDHIAQLSETPSANSTKLSLLNQLRADLVDQAGNAKPLSIQAIRDLRTAMRDELGAKGLRYSDTERRITQAIDSASDDISSQLQGSALRAYQRADRSYRERVDLVDNVVEKFIGGNRLDKRSGEQVIGAIESAARPRSGNAVALDRLMSRLQPAERKEVAATVAAQLGRRGDDAEAAFSPALFFSQVKNYSPEARTAIFGRQGAADLADLAVISEGRNATMGRLNNSRSGAVGNWMEAVKGVLAGGGAGAAIGAGTGLGVAAGSGIGFVGAPLIAGGAYVTARMMGNPRVVTALAQAARATSNPARAQAVRYLTTIANREPSLSAEIIPIRDTLQAALAQSPGRAAAANDEQQ